MKGKVRAEETALVTDKVLEEIGIDASRAPPLGLLIPLVRDVARDMGIELTEHEIQYIAVTNIAWVFRDINTDLAAKGAEIRKKDREKLQ